MAKLGSASLTGQGIASVRGGSNPLGSKSVVFATISKEGGVSSGAVPFSNARGEQFSKFLRSVKGSDGGPALLFPSQELSAKQSEAIKSTEKDPINAEPVIPQSSRTRENKPTVIWFGPALPNLIPERGAEAAQPTLVEKSIKFKQPASEVAVKGEPHSVTESANIRTTVEPAEVVMPESALIDIPRRALSVVEQVNMAIMIKRVRAFLRPKPQEMPLVEAQAEPKKEPYLGVGTNTREIQEIKLEPTINIPEEKVRLRSKKTRIIPEGRKEVSPEKTRTRFVERDLEMNAWRLNRLVKSYLELAAENQGGVDGSALATRSLIGSSRELRSVFLDQRGYRDRQDGSQKRMELFLSSVRSINKEELKKIVRDHTAVKETYEKPREMASVREVNEVVNEPRILESRYEPVEIEEIVEERRVEAKDIYNGKKVDTAPVVFDEKPVNEEELSETKDIQEPQMGILSRLDLIGHNIDQILGEFRIPLLQRRDLVLN